MRNIVILLKKRHIIYKFAINNKVPETRIQFKFLYIDYGDV